ncbi:Ger(x)C family spore germination protein [Paenibacillus sp. BSR1-1]|uniref:Ger(x)C family spore germination protein n=1 Tax=Paenibacillus sp. BSR1-1 TaxID=3020845 RepID=UPI0025AF4AA8|nr:Ger(x)C family spore germination protein [Paenibacillus sp. BSR1-1]MDN3015986.1 Ger(x)C family spore germination protein [Paenibacillus sp. BSR1-1]
MKYHLLIIFIMVTFFLAGCQFNDIDKRFFVVAIGIDQPENAKHHFRVMLKLTIPSAQVEAGKSDFQIITQESNSISEAIRVIQSLVDKKLDFGHCRVIVLDKKIMQSNQLDLMKWFIKRPDIQGITYVAVGEPSAKEVLSWKVKSERLPANALVLAFNEVTNRSPYVLSEILNDYYMRLRESGIDPYLPIIKPINGSFKINTSVVLKGKTIKAELNRDETRLLNELLNPEKTALIDVGKGKDQIFVNAEQTKTNMKIIIPKKGNPYVDVQIKIKGFIEESQKNLHRRSDIKESEKKAAILVSARVKNFLEHLQKLEVDPLGLGLKYQVKHGITKNELYQWKNLYPKLEFHVKSDVKLKGTGTMY